MVEKVTLASTMTMPSIGMDPALARDLYLITVIPQALLCDIL